jgi:hypothetical protein
MAGYGPGSRWHCRRGKSVEDAKALLAAQPDGVPGASHKQGAE